MEWVAQCCNGAGGAAGAAGSVVVGYVSEFENVLDVEVIDIDLGASGPAAFRLDAEVEVIDFDLSVDAIGATLVHAGAEFGTESVISADSGVVLVTGDVRIITCAGFAIESVLSDASGVAAGDDDMRVH